MLYTLGVFTDIYGEGAEMTVGRALLISFVGFLLVFVILSIIALFVKAQGKIFDGINVRREEKSTGNRSLTADETPSPLSGTRSPLPESESQGQLKLTDVSEEEAVLIMAIVARDSGIPLNHLQFNSIRLLEETK